MLRLPSAPTFLGHFFGLFYPKTCLVCAKKLAATDELLCLRCHAAAPRTAFHLEKTNEMTDRLFGRLRIESAAAMFYFSKTRGSQRILHQIKYADKPHLAVRLGRNYGRLLARSPHFEGLTAIVPVPLHPKKERKRGYNQSEKFAEGLAETMHLPIKNLLRRLEHHEKSQARSSREERFQAVEGLYALQKEAARRETGGHFLLVDDVMTSGATIESCGRLLLEIDGAKVSVATIATTSRTLI